MTNSEITTQPNTIHNPPAWEVLAAVRQPGPGPVNHTAIAQWVAGADYDAVLALTHDGPLAANAYHMAYQRYVRDHQDQGAGPLCNCDLCQRELGCIE